MNIAEQIKNEARLSSYKGEDAVLSADEVLKRYKANNPTGQAYKSKLATLDTLTGGFYPGQLIVISGITGQGKTTLAQTFTHSLTEQGVKPLWLSYELPVDDFMRAFHIDYHKRIYMPGNLKDNSLQWIEERVIESKLKYSTQAIFIDHIHYLVSMAPKNNLSFVMGETVRGLKQLAIKHRIMVFLIAHMMKTRSDEEPGLGHIRDSSFIEQESDMSLYVWRFRDDKQITVLKIAKNRRRGIIDDKIPLVLINGRYYEKQHGKAEK